MTEHENALSGFPVCGPCQGRAGSQSRATPILPPGWAWHPENTKIKEGITRHSKIKISEEHASVSALVRKGTEEVLDKFLA